MLLSLFLSLFLSLSFSPFLSLSISLSLPLFSISKTLTELRTVINPFYSSLQVNITILDINDNSPMWRDEPYHANVVEMSPIDTDVISVSSACLDL